ncbi:uncharacterized protein LOC110674258 [Aedes aegypti]|uniref:Uncharacterized protein n=1 Tax=Aedes aegypti TaxID=7159 RepID=A0A6I8U5E4_AEDAE|nr:uncharacterized protein LOC110674258 [Aedes aegypti]
MSTELLMPTGADGNQFITDDDFRSNTHVADTSDSLGRQQLPKFSGPENPNLKVIRPKQILPVRQPLKSGTALIQPKSAPAETNTPSSTDPQVGDGANPSAAGIPCVRGPFSIAASRPSRRQTAQPKTDGPAEDRRKAFWIRRLFLYCGWSSGNSRSGHEGVRLPTGLQDFGIRVRASTIIDRIARLWDPSASKCDCRLDFMGRAGDWACYFGRATSQTKNSRETTTSVGRQIGAVKGY